MLGQTALRRRGQPIRAGSHPLLALFELFVMADATGFWQKGSEPIYRATSKSPPRPRKPSAARWNLAQSMPGGLSQPSSLPPDQLSRFATCFLWSFMRMWMEWTLCLAGLWGRIFHKARDDQGPNAKRFCEKVSSCEAGPGAALSGAIFRNLGIADFRIYQRTLCAYQPSADPCRPVSGLPLFAIVPPGRRVPKR